MNLVMMDLIYLFSMPVGLVYDMELNQNAKNNNITGEAVWSDRNLHACQEANI